MLPLCHVRAQGEGRAPGTGPRALLSDPSLQGGRQRRLQWEPPAYGTLLQQPEQTGTHRVGTPLRGADSSQAPGPLPTGHFYVLSAAPRCWAGQVEC